MVRSFFILICSLFSISSFAQKEMEEVRNIFRDELAKAGLNVRFANSPSQNGIYLQLAGAGDRRLKDLAEDAFHIKADHQSIQISSSSENGLRNAAWWYLHQLGFRYYFPHEDWHVVPHLSSPYKKLEATISPSFTYRRIWYAYGTGSDKATADYKKWFAANLQGGAELSAGHSYDGIVNRNKAEFQKHPEYFAQKVSRGSIPRDPKFEVSNEELVQLVIRDVRKQIENAIRKTGKAPGMISLDPSDGGGFSTSAASKKIGGPSEQVFYLVNRVARAIRKDYPSVKIGLYAYNFHAAPPSFDIEPNVTVLIATAMNRSEYRTEELVELWRKKGVTVGLRDYYGVMAWDWDMPGQPRGSKISYVKKLKDEYRNGIRLFSAETNIGWISRGPAHYLAARLLWDVNLDEEKVLDEFYVHMFGKAASQIRHLYAQWENYPHAVPLEGDIVKWLELVRDAAETEKDKDVQERLDQIKQYLHYVILYKRWKDQPTDPNLVNLFNYAYRIQDEGIVASYPLFRRLANSYVDGKAHMRFDDPGAIWKRNHKPVDQKEINKNLYEDLASLNKDQTTVFVSYPQTFVPGFSLNKSKESGSLKFRGRQLFIIQVTDPGSAAFQIHVGLIKANSYKELKLRIFPYHHSMDLKKSIRDLNFSADRPLHSASLSFLPKGTYLFEFDDAGGGFQIAFKGGISYGVVADEHRALKTFSRNNLVFLVPEGTKQFILINSDHFTLLSPAGRTIKKEKGKEQIIVEVKKGEAGVWKLNKQIGSLTIKNILPLVSDSQDFLIRYNE